jgi:hypothetical protein
MIYNNPIDIIDLLGLLGITITDSGIERDGIGLKAYVEGEMTVKDSISKDISTTQVSVYGAMLDEEEECIECPPFQDLYEVFQYEVQLSVEAKANVTFTGRVEGTLKASMRSPAWSIKSSLSYSAIYSVLPNISWKDLNNPTKVCFDPARLGMSSYMSLSDVGKNDMNTIRTLFPSVKKAEDLIDATKEFRGFIKKNKNTFKKGLRGLLPTSL